MEALVELDSICRFLDSDKVTERKVVWKSHSTSFLCYLHMQGVSIKNDQLISSQPATSAVIQQSADSSR